MRLEVKRLTKIIWKDLPLVFGVSVLLKPVFLNLTGYFASFAVIQNGHTFCMLLHSAFFFFGFFFVLESCA